ncbi:unnamed protein product, partial [marine sediment metagenome]
RGRFLFLPHGPVVKAQNEKRKAQSLEELVKKLKKIAKQEDCSFIRIAPIWQRNEENKKIFKDLGFRAAPFHTHPEITWELNLQKPEEELLILF